MKKSQEVSIASPEYRQFIEDLKARVLSARISAARAVNRDVILLYWDIGRGIVEKQQTLGWGDSIVEMVSADLRQAFPGSFGFSPQNVWRMLQFFRTHTDNLFLSQAVRELETKGQKTPTPEELSQLVRELIAAVSWGHHANVLAKLTDPAARLYYLRATARFGWSRNVLLNQIKAGAYERAVTEKKGRRGSRVRPAHESEPHRCGRVSTPIEIAGGYEGQTADGETAYRRRAGSASRKERPMTQYFHRYQPPTPAKDLQAKFWKLEKEEEKMLEGLAK